MVLCKHFYHPMEDDLECIYCGHVEYTDKPELDLTFDIDQKTTSEPIPYKQERFRSLTDEQAREILIRLKQPDGNFAYQYRGQRNDLAREFNVDPGIITSLKGRGTYRHIQV